MLAFEVEWRLADGRRLRQPLALRYSPLLRHYELAIGSSPPQPHALRNHLLAAMENARLRWPAEAACAGACAGQVRVRLDPAALPAPLRLPALVDGDWHFDSGWVGVAGAAQDTRLAARAAGAGAARRAGPERRQAPACRKARAACPVA